MDEQKREALLRKRAELRRKLREEAERRLIAERLRRWQDDLVAHTREGIEFLRATAGVVVDAPDGFDPSEAGELVKNIMYCVLHSGAPSGHAPIDKAGVILERISDVLGSGRFRTIYYLYPGLYAGSAVLELNASAIAPHTAALWSGDQSDVVVASTDLMSGASVVRIHNPYECEYELDCTYWGAFDLRDITEMWE